MSEIGDYIKEMRKVCGISMKELAERVSELTGHDYSANMISMWESGKRRIYADQLCDLCLALGCSPNFMFPAFHNNNDRDNTIIDRFMALPEDEREIIKFCSSEWDGNSRALVYFMGLYMGLDAMYRQDLAEYGVWRYEDAVRTDHLNPKAPSVKINYIKEQCKKIKSIKKIIYIEK